MREFEGRRGRNSWQPDGVSRGKVAWAGRDGAVEEGDEVRFFTSEWTNPHPEKTVAAIDFETGDTPAAPFLVALMLERGLGRKGTAGR